MFARHIKRNVLASGTPNYWQPSRFLPLTSTSTSLPLPLQSLLPTLTYIPSLLLHLPSHFLLCTTPLPISSTSQFTPLVLSSIPFLFIFTSLPQNLFPQPIYLLSLSPFLPPLHSLPSIFTFPTTSIPSDFNSLSPLSHLSSISSTSFHSPRPLIPHPPSSQLLAPQLPYRHCVIS